MNYSRYEVVRDTKKEFRFNLIANNNEVILTSSEGYVNKSDCLHAIEICQRYSPYEGYYSKRKTIREQYYFILQAGNGEGIGRSEDYPNSSVRDRGVDAVKRNGSTQNVVDRS